jgi:hypothetical protein
MPPATLGYGWLIAEDHAMKTYLQEMTVTDTTAPPGGRPVKVWFRQPEQETRERTYPYVTIDLVDMVEANNRAMVNRLKLSQLQYTPPDPLPVLEVNHTQVAERPVPVDLYYQITVVSRSSHHDRQLQAALMRKFPGKWGALYVPNDETARTMQLQGFASASDIDEHGKRTFRRIYTVTVASELWPTVVKQIQNMDTIGINLQLVSDPTLVLTHLNCDSEE